MKGWLKFAVGFLAVIVVENILFKIIYLTKWEWITILFVCMALIVFPYGKLKK